MAKLTTRQLKLRCQELEETGKIGEGVDGDEVGQILDFYNQQLEDEHRDDFAREVNARNKYHWKLAKWAALHPGEPYRSTGTIMTSKPDEEEGGEE